MKKTNTLNLVRKENSLKQNPTNISNYNVISYHLNDNNINILSGFIPNSL